MLMLLPSELFAPSLETELAETVKLEACVPETTSDKSPVKSVVLILNILVWVLFLFVSGNCIRFSITPTAV